MERKLDLTKGPDIIDCSEHCPAKIFNEKKPHVKYLPFFNEDFILEMLDKPYCNDIKAPYEGENKPRKFLKRITLVPRRICLYWNDLLTQTPE
jgi:hypothetical protein